MIGELLLNRYEILAKVGDGGMAQVFRARDIVLNRLVAIKILRSQFATDNEFIERFRREAQAAASLSHPNVVNIYDVGHVNETHFIVMEYVEGRTLGEIIGTEERLEQEFIIDVGSQICLALAHAHQHDIVHRDIKPHNILLTKDGRVKVTDFGIARAVSSANLTQTGMILGSVHYFSPEQARGNNVESASDLYSLGVVLYEMITGRVPFRGDTAIAVALKQIQEEPMAPRQISPEIGAGLERIVLKLLAKDPNQRYGSAEEVGQSLRLLQSDTQTIASDYAADRTRKLPKVDVGEEVEDQVSPRKTNRKAKRKKQKRSLTIFVLVLALMLGMSWGVFRVLPSVLFPQEVTVPNIIGMSRPEAETLLNQRGLRLGVDREVFDNQIPVNHVISQDPAANRRVKENRTIFIRLSKGAEYVDMPSVEGQTLREARLNLTQAGFTLGEELAEFDPAVAINTVVRQDPPPGQRVQKGMPVNLVVSKGQEEQAIVSLPDFRGQSLERARQRLEALGLELGNAWPEYSTVVAENQIIEQNPPAGSEVEVGWEIDFVFSQGLPRGADPFVEEEPEEDEEEIERWTTDSQWHSVEVRINVPEGPSQEVVILVVDDFGAREVYREVRSGGTSITRTVQGRGEGARLQVYIGGRMFLDEFFRDLN